MARVVLRGTTRPETASSEEDMERTWSDEQNPIFGWFATGAGNLVIRARAGTGKTTTVVEGINRAHDGRILLAAFNKVIADELQSRIRKPGAEAKTLHALGFQFLRQAWPKAKVERKGEGISRKYGLADRVLPARAPQSLRRAVADLHTAGRDQLVNHTVATLLPLAFKQDIVLTGELEDLGYTEDDLAGFALSCIELAAERTEVIDFADMIFLPLRHKWTQRRYDLVVIDECQDMNLAQIALAQSVARDRIVVVGDDRQCLYSWRGADADSLDRLKKLLKAQELGLKTTFRCPKTVVALAAQLVPDFVAAPAAPEGVVRRVNGVADALSAVGIGDFILSRTNAPLVPLCLTLLKRGVPARVRGRDIAAGLTALCKRLETKSGARELPELLTALSVWCHDIFTATTRKVEAGKLEEEQATELISDAQQRLDTIVALADGLASIRELYSRFDTLFSDSNPVSQVTLSTVHRAKGLEADRVWLLESTFRRKVPCGLDGASETRWREGDEEQNIRYVAITRAKRELVWVPGDLGDIEQQEDSAP